MIEFDINKQGGIKLHRCERKSRVCTFSLLLSWIVVSLFLGWLYIEGYLHTDKDTQNPQVSMSECENSVAALSTGIDNSEENKEETLECDKKLVGLKKQLEQANNLALKQKMVKYEARIKQSEKLLQQAREQIKTRPDNVGAPAPDVLEKLTYYEKILKADGDKDAVSITDFGVKKARQDRHFRFQIVLAKLGKHRFTKGDFEIYLEGNKKPEVQQKTNKSSDGTQEDNQAEKIPAKQETVTYKHTDLLPAGAITGTHTRTNVFAFKYYQILEGEFVLPENFEVNTLTVSVKPQGLAVVKKNYAWKQVKQRFFKEDL